MGFYKSGLRIWNFLIFAKFTGRFLYKPTQGYHKQSFWTFTWVVLLRSYIETICRHRDLWPVITGTSRFSKKIMTRAMYYIFWSGLHHLFISMISLRIIQLNFWPLDPLGTYRKLEGHSIMVKSQWLLVIYGPVNTRVGNTLSTHNLL